jgi:PAS domain S-box-containing protein
MSMNKPGNGLDKRILGRTFWWALISVWTAIIAGSLAWDIHDVRKSTSEMVYTEVLTNFNKDLLYRRWVAIHGGVYAPVTEKTPPNPFLANIKERDILTPSGRLLTLINPAYMTRQVYELELEQYGVRSHITSLNPIRLENSADAWETRALQTFAQGKAEFSETVDLNGEPYFRFMRPMITEEGCLECHAVQGYKLGEIRGGISIAVPLKEYYMKRQSHINHIAAGHFFIWVLGLAGILLSERSLRKRIYSQKQTEEELRQSEKMLQTIFDTEPECVKLLDSKGNLIMMNRAGLNMLEVDSLDQVKGQCVCPMVASEHRQAFMDLTAKVFEGGSGTLMFEMVGLKGGHLWLETHAVPFRDEKDEIVALLGITRDITEHRRLEAQLRQAQKMEAVGSLAGGIAHDFNNILTAIIGYSEIAMTALPEDHPEQKHLKIINESGQRAAALTQQILAFSRKQTLEMKPVSMNEIIDSISQMLHRIIGEDIRLALHPDRSIPQVRADAGQMEQVITNLAVNARDAMPSGGSLIIETSVAHLEEGFAGHAGIKPGDYVVISVSDTGVGIPGDIIDKIFDPFFTTKAIGKGTGLGLAMVYGIVKQHGGHINVYSESGKGTTFRIYLPVIQDKLKELQKVELPPVYEGTGTILVVDDEALIRKMLGDYLGPLGYTVLGAASGDEAMAVSKSFGAGIDLLLTDVIMTDIDGKGLAQKIQEVRRDIRVIYMSGYTHDIIAHHGVLDEGINFIEKPIDFVKLVAMIQRVMGTKKVN